MSTLSIQQNVILGLGEGINIADSTALEYSLRWANAAYRELFLRYRFKNLRTRSIFTTTAGQSTYQAPTDIGGFLILKDETNQNIINQVTPEEFQRDISANKITDESFTSSSGVAVSLDQNALIQYSEVVTNTAGTTTYTRDTDYSMNYTSGTITMASSGGSMSDATEYYIDYLYYIDGKPTKFCLEYDATNERYVFRLDPIPTGSYIGSLLYSALPSNLSSSVNPLWDRFEFALERGGIYYGSLEILDDLQKRAEFKQIYETAMMALVQLDQDLLPRQDRIKVVLRKGDY